VETRVSGKKSARGHAYGRKCVPTPDPTATEDQTPKHGASDWLEGAHSLQAGDVLEGLGVSAESGLSQEEAIRRRAVSGANAIVSKRKTSTLAILLHQISSPVIYLLAGAAALAFHAGETEEGAAIVAVLALNMIIGMLTEWKAARSIEALRALTPHTARVRRDGSVQMIPARDVVPGDIIIFSAGDAVCADVRLVEAANLNADESTLTGESTSVGKHVHPVVVNARLADRACMLFSGTKLVRGYGIGVVTATGHGTELGRISHLVAEAGSGTSPLEYKLATLSVQLVWAVLGLCALLVGVGLATGKDTFVMFEAGIALAVAVIPEGLPVVATLVLARGMWRLARENALIERLAAVETLGATTLILTDKTGTLTENRMAVQRMWLPAGEWSAGGAVPASSTATSVNRQRLRLLTVAVLCNDASLDPKQGEGSGDPMEIALLKAGAQAGLGQTVLLHRYPVQRRIAFDESRKMMATVHRDGDTYLYAVKGAPESVLAAAEHSLTDEAATNLDAAKRSEWRRHAEQLAGNGFRVLACASKTSMRADAEPYEGLTWLGLVALEDPVRSDVPPAIAACRAAGIRVVMATGDHAATAHSIGQTAGLGDAHMCVITGEQLERMVEQDEPPVPLSVIDIFARVTPAEKLALVRAFQAGGDVVAMTGDGVNDAPALRQADIGVAMGKRGTDVAREAAAMVLLDDAFPTIVKAIREGRVIYANIRRFVAYLLSCNLSEVIVVGVAVVAGWPLPILPLQILYLNLVTDVFPAFALAMCEGERDVLTRPPRDPQEPILGARQWKVIALQGLALTAATLAAMQAARVLLNLDARSVTTVAFLTLAFAQLWHTFDMRDTRAAVWRNEVTINRWIWAALALCTILLAGPPYLPSLAHLMELTPPTTAMWGLVLGMSLGALVVTQSATVCVRAWRRSR